MTGITPDTHIGRKLRTFDSVAGQNVVLAGEKQALEALDAALRALGFEPRIHAPEGLPGTLVSLERALEENRPDAVIAVGTNEDAVALAITAGKLGVPLAAAGAGEGTQAADEQRIIGTLATIDAGGDSSRAADLIASWLSGETPRSDLD
jgi:hypothetical protein